ncbi:MAG: molybdopterin-guanine dinucleotide biosynthesis protein B, partial [Dehalococcoidales bacterium]
MPPIISIVGKSESGKTTLLEGLITILKQRGYKVAVIKHAAEDFELDTVNKDSWRFRQAGSEVSAISSTHHLAVIKNLEHDLAPQELANFIGLDYDLILTEGFKQSDHPKIEVHRKEQGKELLNQPERLLAVVTD